MKWNTFQHVVSSPSRKPIHKRCRPGLEELEARWLPSVTMPGYQHIIIDQNPSVAGSDTLEKALVDINGDGKLDAVLGEGQANGGPGGLYWYQAPSSGNLSDPWIKHTIAASGNFYESIVPFDVNGDGAPDLIASDNDQVVWFENPRGHGGNPATDPWTMHIIRAGGGAHEMVLADINGDGKMDVVVSSSQGLGSSSAVLIQNNPDSWTQVNFGHTGDGVGLLDIGSGKGAIDIVGADNGNLVWWENPREHGGNPLTDPWIERVIGTVNEADGISIASGVLTSNGRMDVIVAGNEGTLTGQGGLQWFEAPQDRRNGTWILHTIDASYQAVHQITVADMNHDGTQDLVVSEEEQAHNSPPGYNQNFNLQRVAVFYNDGNGNFTQQVLATTGGQNQVVGDIEGDGDLDVLNANHGFYGAPNPLEIWVNQLNQNQPPPPPPPNGNLIQDPAFENQTNTSTLNPPWYIQDPSGEQINMEDLGTAHSGAKEANFWQPNNTGNTSFSDIYQTVTVTPNTNYTLSAWFDDSDNSGFTGGEFGVRTTGGSVVAQTAIPPTGGVSAMGYYQQVSLTFNSGSNTALQVFAGYTPTQFSWLHVDDVSLIATSPPPPPPPSPLPSPWTDADIGNVGVAGSASYSNGVFTVRGSGTDIWDPQDQFNFVYQQVTGDATIIAHVSNVQNTDFYANAGVMFRDSLSGTANQVYIGDQPGVPQEPFVIRNGSSQYLGSAGTAGNIWLKLVRSGNTFTEYSSSDGVNWGSGMSTTVPMGGTVDVGIFSNSHNNSVLGSATFDHVSVTSSTPPPPPPSGNLIQNPGFETGSLPPWVQEGSASSSVDTNAQHAHSGTASAALWGVSGSADLAQNVTVTPNTNYTLSAWVDASSTTNGALGVKTTGGTVLASAALTNTDPGPYTHQADFRLYSVTFNSGNNSTLNVFAGYQGSGNGFINLDDVSLTPSSANLVKNAGFEASNSLTNWSVQGTPDSVGIDTLASHSHSGNHNAYIWDQSHAGQFLALTQTIAVQPNTNYTLTAWINASNTTNGALGVRTTGGTVIAQAPFVNTDPGPVTNAAGYRQYTVTFNSGSNTQLVIFFGYVSPGSGSYINLDDVSLVAM
jgi:hypothetical protein